MSSATYTLSSNDFVLAHGLGRVHTFRDQDDKPGQIEIEALVASGDCFVTLATRIDEVTESLATGPADPKAFNTLERLTMVLLYLQRHYKIVRKQSDHRQ